MRCMQGIAVLSLFFGSLATPSLAAVEAVEWTSGTTGTIGSIDVTLANGDGSTFTTDLSGPEYSAAPLSATQVLASVGNNDDWILTFSEPVTNPLIYMSGWRNAGLSQTYTFDSPIELLSGDGAAAGMVYTPGDGFNDGILLVLGTVSSITLDSSAGNLSGFQSVTFALQPIPTPAALPAGMLLFVGLAMRRKR